MKILSQNVYKKFSVIFFLIFCSCSKTCGCNQWIWSHWNHHWTFLYFWRQAIAKYQMVGFWWGSDTSKCGQFLFQKAFKRVARVLLYKMIVKSSLLAFWKKRAACYFPEGGFSKQDSSSTSLGSSLKLELERLLILEKQATQLQLLHTLFGLQKNHAAF